MIWPLTRAAAGGSGVGVAVGVGGIAVAVGAGSVGMGTVSSVGAVLGVTVDCGGELFSQDTNRIPKDRMVTSIARTVKLASSQVCHNYYTVVTEVGKQVSIWQKNRPMLELPAEERDVLFPPFARMAAAVLGRRFVCVGTALPRATVGRLGWKQM
jgi:hypothetical protein